MAGDYLVSTKERFSKYQVHFLVSPKSTLKHLEQFQYKKKKKKIVIDENSSRHIQIFFPL